MVVTAAARSSCSPRFYENVEKEILRPLVSKMTFFGHIKSLEMAFERKKSAKTYNLNLPKIGGI